MDIEMTAAADAAEQYPNRNATAAAAVSMNMYSRLDTTKMG
jgi:hypothetical protein